MLYPPQFIERLRNHFLLSELIGGRVALKKHGREYMGLCPFHGEKTPSFTVNNEKGFFHCFGCAAHGDAIEFIKRYERLEWKETIEKLAREAGIPLPVMSREEVEKERAAKSLYDALEAAAAWFEKNISAPDQARARDYIRSRGLSEDTLKNFRIGFAPDGREGLKKHLLAAGFAEAQLIESGLVIKPEDGPTYDRFRGRVMFPIRNTKGQVIAFGGRLMDAKNKNLPKYLNSPETPVFHKGHVLFNLDRASKPAREQDAIVIVEGYMDCISLAQAGVTYAVATLGTAVTPEHLRLLWHYAKEPVICLDGDAAGQRAMLRAAEIALPLLTPDHSLRFATLPAGDDPDTFVQKNGKAAFENTLTSAPRLSQALWESVHSAHSPSTPEGLAALDHACKQSLQKIADLTVRKAYQKEFDGHLYHLRGQLWKKGSGRVANEKPRSPEVVRMAMSDATAPFDALAHQLFGLLHKFPDLAHRPHLDEVLSKLDLRDAKLEALRVTLIDALHEGNAERVCADVTGETRVQTFEEAGRQMDKILFACEDGTLMTELEHLRVALEENWDEAACARVQALQKERNDLKEKRKMDVLAAEDA